MLLLFVVTSLGYLKVETVKDRYIDLVRDFETGSSVDPFVRYVKDQLPNLALYRFYKIKMVGSVDKRESALDIPYFLMALVKVKESKTIGYESLNLGKFCEEEESFSFEFGLFTEEEERKKKEEEEEKCLKKILSALGKNPREERLVSLDFNELFARALFLSYVESRLEKTNVTESLVKHSAALTYAFNLYNDYVSDDLEFVFTHYIGYYLGVIHEKIPFEIPGVSKVACENCKYVKVYPGEEYLRSFMKNFDEDDVLGVKKRIEIAVNLLATKEYTDSREFEWNIRLASQFLFERFFKDSMTKMEWTDLRENMERMLEHTMAYYLGGTDVIPPISLDVPVRKLRCGNESCVYRFFRYKAPDQLKGILTIPDVKASINEVLTRLSQERLSPEDLSKEIERVSDELEGRAKDDIQDLKDKLAKIAAESSPRSFSLWWLRFLFYVVLLSFSMFKGRWKLTLTLVALVEMFYITFFIDLNSRGEGLFYSLAMFYTFAFALLLSLKKPKKNVLWLIFGTVFIALLFMPTYMKSEFLKMSSHPEFHDSPYYDLLKDDLFDGAKFERKGKLMEEEIESRFGRYLIKALASENPEKSLQFKSALKLAENIFRYSDEKLKSDFMKFLKLRLADRKDLLVHFEKLYEKYQGRTEPPHVVSLQAYSSAKAAIIFMMIFALGYFGVNNIVLSGAALAAGIFFLLEKAVVFVEYAVPTLQLKGRFINVPWVEILLIILSAMLIKKLFKGRVKT